MILLGKATAKTSFKKAYIVTCKRQEGSIPTKCKVIAYLVGESFQTADISWLYNCPRPHPCILPINSQLCQGQHPTRLKPN